MSLNKLEVTLDNPKHTFLKRIFWTRGRREKGKRIIERFDNAMDSIRFPGNNLIDET